MAWVRLGRAWLSIGLFALLAPAILAGKDYYSLLGVRRNAPEKEIQKSFRKLSLKYHPDKNKDPGAVKKFQEMSSAYEVLMDPEKRRLYDQVGEEGLKRGGAPPPEQGFGGGQRRRPPGTFGFGGGGRGAHDHGGFGGGFGGFGDMFGDMFGAQRGPQEGARQRQQQQPRAAQPSIYKGSKFIKDLSSPDKFEKEVLAHDSLVWVVHLYTTGTVGSDMKGKVEAAAKELVGMANFGAVVCDNEATRDLCQKQGDGIRVYAYGASKESQKLEPGSQDISAAIKKAVIKTLPNFSLKLDEANIDKRLHKSEGQVRAILFTSKSSTPNTWKAASAQFRNKVTMYDVQGAEPPDKCALCERYGVTKVPTVVGLVPGVSNAQHMPEKADMTEWLARLEKQKKAGSSGSSDDGQGVLQLQPSNFNSACGESTPVCVIAIIRKRSSTKTVKLLQEVASKAKLRQSKGSSTASGPHIVYAWVDLEPNSAFASTFGLQSRAEGVVAFKPKRLRYKTHAGGMDASSLEDFVVQVLSGDLQFEKLSQAPSIR